MMLLEPVGLEINEVSFARWRHFVAACGSDRGYPRAVLSLEQGLTSRSL